MRCSLHRLNQGNSDSRPLLRDGIERLEGVTALQVLERRFLYIVDLGDTRQSNLTFSILPLFCAAEPHFDPPRRRQDHKSNATFTTEPHEQLDLR
jgi:hypothetical protein